jgi:hypothetical protein
LLVVLLAIALAGSFAYGGNGKCDSLGVARDYNLFPSIFPDALYQRWCGCPAQIGGYLDINGDGVEDIVVVFLNDPQMPPNSDAIALHGLDLRIWAFMEWAGDSWAIRWVDPAAPGGWRQWLDERINGGGYGAGKSKELTI